MPSPVEARHIGVYRRGRTIVVVSSVHAELSFIRPPCYVIPDVASDGELGAAVVEAIQSVSLSAPPPTDDERAAWEREVLESVGVKDWATLERNARLAHIGLDGRGWQLNRLRRWRGGGWMSISRDANQVVRLPRGATGAEIGHAVREVLEPPNMHADTASIG